MQLAVHAHAPIGQIGGADAQEAIIDDRELRVDVRRREGVRLALGS